MGIREDAARISTRRALEVVLSRCKLDPETTRILKVCLANAIRVPDDEGKPDA